MAIAADRLAVANWQRTKDGQSGRNKPKPLSPLAAKPVNRMGHTDRSPEEVAAFLASIGPQRAEEA